MTGRTSSKADLDAVFGEGIGDTPEARARQSSRMFVRSLDQLTFDESPRATGRRMTAIEALEAYGWDVLREVAFEGSALLAESPEAAGRALRERREELRLDRAAVARKAGLTTDVVTALEESKRQPIRRFERVASILGLDERMISFRSDPAGNERVAVRLRQLLDEKTALSQVSVVALTEASWVAMTQMRLEEGLGISTNPPIKPDSDYGSSGWPAYRVGYQLAARFRDEMGLDGKPIESMRDFVEQKLGIVVIQTNLGDSIAGATVQSGKRRAIVANLAGANTNVFVRRATLAHEVCHLLYDPQQYLRDLRVDAYAELDAAPDALTDRVEQRANAFAVELLAPQALAEKLWTKAPSSDPLGMVIDHFGISFTAARYQIWNAIERREPLESLSTKRYKPEPSWEGREAYTLAYHPIGSLVEHPARAGRFSAVVVRAAEDGLVSWDTAAEWLLSDERELRSKAPEILALYPDVAVRR
jgi:Zn-dependent peptidase ImmA (M78 family)